MGREIEIVLCKPEQRDVELSLFYDVLDTPIAEQYFLAVQMCELSRHGIVDAERFHNFPHSSKTRAWIASELNARIDLINSYAPKTVQHRAEISMDQAHLNQLHWYFEHFRGPILTPSPFFKSAPENVRTALTDLNLLIHRYEDLERNDEHVRLGDWPIAHAYLSFDKRTRYRLEPSHYSYFSHDYHFGSLLIAYCEVGKPLWDVFNDRDEIVGDDNIRPLRYYSADTLLQFVKTSIVSEDPARIRRNEEFDQWWDANEAKLSALGFTKGDPRNAVGHLRVASIDRNRGVIRGLHELEIIDLVGRHQRFKRVHARLV